MEKNQVVLADGNTYEFSAVGIGWLRRFQEGMARDGADVTLEGTKVLHASLYKKYPEITLDKLMDDLLTQVNYTAAFAAFNAANGIETGEAKPETSSTGA